MRQCAGLSIDDCCVLFEVSKQTVLNWERSKHRPPRAVFLCLEWRDRGLSAIAPQWSGFRAWKDVILSEEGYFIYPEEVRLIKYLYLSAGLSRSRELSRMRVFNPHG